MLARFRARGDARGRAACAGRGPQGMLPLRAFSAFCEGRGVAGSVASSAGAFLRCGVPCWAGLFMDCAVGRLSFVVRRFPIQLFVGPQRAH